MLTAAGSGYSRWGDLGVTRWREDVTRDDSGSYIFLRDVGSGAVWSATYQPCGVLPDSYGDFTEDRAEFVRTDGELTTTLQVVVSPEDDAECAASRSPTAGTTPADRRHVVLRAGAGTARRGHRPSRVLEALRADGVSAWLRALLATRRPRSTGETGCLGGAQAVVEGEVRRALEYETDRARFLGRAASGEPVP
jgi:cyclic beta-1,2-glucan synthetase